MENQSSENQDCFVENGNKHHKDLEEKETTEEEYFVKEEDLQKIKEKVEKLAIESLEAALKMA